MGWRARWSRRAGSEPACSCAASTSGKSLLAKGARLRGTDTLAASGAARYNRHVREPLPDFIVRLLWDVDPQSDRHALAPLIFERVMSRGTWEAMKWLRAEFSRDELATFVRDLGAKRLAPRDLAYWAFICDVEVDASLGGGRPSWAG